MIILRWLYEPTCGIVDTSHLSCRRGTRPEHISQIILSIKYFYGKYFCGEHNVKFFDSLFTCNTDWLHSSSGHKM